MLAEFFYLTSFLVILFIKMEKILVEKLRSLLTHSEPRDLYDVHYLLTNQMVDVEQLSSARLPCLKPKAWPLEIWDRFSSAGRRLSRNYGKQN
jgi:hypothetical protein